MIKSFRLSALILFVGLIGGPAFAVERMVAVDGVRQHIVQEGAGPIGVVFVSGVGEGADSWSKVAPQTAQFARTFSYDRPGLGRSEPTKRPRTVGAMAAELHRLLRVAGFKGRFVLVGHSLGGAIAQVYAHRYSGEVKGLVLVDPEDGRLDQLLRNRMAADAWETHEDAVRRSMPTMPAPVRAELGAYQRSGPATAAASLPHVPIVLLTGTKKNPEFPGNPLEQDAKLELHEAMLGGMPGARHVLVANSRHYIQDDAPAEVIKAIRSVAGLQP